MDKKDGPIDLESLRGFTPGPWAVESIRNEGSYGDGGPDCRSGFDSYCVQDAEGRALFDTLNSDDRVAIVHEDVHDEGVTAWDEQGLRNITLAASAPALLNECQRLQAELTARRARDAEVVAALIASELARIDGYDPDDEHGGLYDLRWSGGTNPEPEGDAWHMDYLPKGERIAAIITGAKP